MAQADSDNTTDASAGPLAALAAAVHPAWHQANLRLASASERMAQLSGWVVSNPQDNDPGSFDRMMDQNKSWMHGWAAMNDNELDDCDHEDADPAEFERGFRHRRRGWIG
jgi:hypothetical protein